MPEVISSDNPAPDNQQSDKSEKQNAFSLASEQQPAVRERTQTDRLNKNLLNAYLLRINTGNLNFEQDDEDDQNDEWN